MKDVLYTNFRIFKKTRNNLRWLHSQSRESMISILDRLVEKEVRRVESAENKKQKTA